MTRLTRDQQQFLKNQKIPESLVFDAAGMAARARRAQMRALGAVVCIGVSPCQAAGHTLRTAAGHCAQCNTHALAFQQRCREKGFVYVAESKSLGLVKIGTTQDIDRRIQSLRALGYGGADDWHIKVQFSSSEAGRVELAAQSGLQRFRVDASYQREGRSIVARELFRVTVQQAEETVIRLIPTGRLDKPHPKRTASLSY